MSSKKKDNEDEEEAEKAKKRVRFEETLDKDHFALKEKEFLWNLDIIIRHGYGKDGMELKDITSVYRKVSGETITLPMVHPSAKTWREFFDRPHLQDRFILYSRSFGDTVGLKRTETEREPLKSGQNIKDNPNCSLFSQIEYSSLVAQGVVFTPHPPPEDGEEFAEGEYEYVDLKDDEDLSLPTENVPPPPLLPPPSSSSRKVPPPPRITPKAKDEKNSSVTKRISNETFKAPLPPPPPSKKPTVNAVLPSSTSKSSTSTKVVKESLHTKRDQTTVAKTSVINKGEDRARKNARLVPEMPKNQQIIQSIQDSFPSPIQRLTFELLSQTDFIKESQNWLIYPCLNWKDDETVKLIWSSNGTLKYKSEGSGGGWCHLECDEISRAQGSCSRNFLILGQVATNFRNNNNINPHTKYLNVFDVIWVENNYYGNLPYAERKKKCEEFCSNVKKCTHSTPIKVTQLSSYFKRMKNIQVLSETFPCVEKLVGEKSAISGFLFLNESSHTNLLQKRMLLFSNRKLLLSLQSKVKATSSSTYDSSTLLAKMGETLTENNPLYKQPDPLFKRKKRWSRDTKDQLYASDFQGSVPGPNKLPTVEEKSEDPIKTTPSPQKPSAKPLIDKNVSQASSSPRPLSISSIIYTYNLTYIPSPVIKDNLFTNLYNSLTTHLTPHNIGRYLPKMRAAHHEWCATFISEKQLDNFETELVYLKGNGEKLPQFLSIRNAGDYSQPIWITLSSKSRIRLPANDILYLGNIEQEATKESADDAPAYMTSLKVIDCLCPSEDGKKELRFMNIEEKRRHIDELNCPNVILRTFCPLDRFFECHIKKLEVKGQGSKNFFTCQLKPCTSTRVVGILFHKINHMQADERLYYKFPNLRKNEYEPFLHKMQSGGNEGGGFAFLDKLFDLNFDH